MSTAKDHLYFFSNLVAYVAVSLATSNISYSQNLQIIDTANAQSAFSKKAGQDEISNQKSSDNFYITDSIFSFRSPKGYVPSLIDNFAEQTVAPFHLNKKQWLLTGAAIGITAFLIHVDNEVDDWASTQRQRHNWINKSSPVITQFGGNYATYSVAAIGILSASFKNQKGVQTSLLATQALFTSGIWVRLIKLITGRERPMAKYIYSRTEGGKWYGPFSQFDQDLAIKRPGSAFDSFPSGHTATAFSIATVFASQYNDTKVIPILSYSAATLVGVSRLTEHEHWASDVFVGALVGYVCGKEVVSHYNKTHQNNDNSSSSKSKNKTEFTFFQEGNQTGLCLKW